MALARSICNQFEGQQALYYREVHNVMIKIIKEKSRTYHDSLVWLRSGEECGHPIENSMEAWSRASESTASCDRG